jgi:hypothetical protein
MAALLSGLNWGSLRADDSPRVLELRTQRVGSVVYFQVRFETPPNMEPGPRRPGAEDGINTPFQPEPSRLPRLVPQDGVCHAVCPQVDVSFPPGQGPNLLPVVVPANGLNFLGKADRETDATFLLLYPTRQAPGSARGWGEIPVHLDLASATKVSVPPEAKKREAKQVPARDDLEGLWAVAQAEQFSALQGRAGDFSFFGFARDATGRKYGVPTSQSGPGSMRVFNHEMVDRQLYDTTTGAAAITETLQRERMLNSAAGDKSEGNVEISKVAGIDIAQHPWKEMIGDKKPVLEPLSHFVPNDNYYLHFKSVGKLLELGELLDAWGTNLIRAYEVSSRDYRLRERYEKQLCIRSSTLGKLLGPTVIESVAITGSDLYLREGSDVTILFQSRNAAILKAALEPFIQEARKEFGGRLQERKESYQGLTIEGFTTPLREISLHRITLANVVIYSNSQVALRRIIDTKQGRIEPLADSLDFQYMRTIFHVDDAQEDGFVFLSDPFIRQFVGPASKIKEKRRLEALTSLRMLTNGVMFTAWEKGPNRADTRGTLEASVLKPEELHVPGGQDVSWDAEQRLAVSDVYNTLAFVTPLIELPIDRVTQAEAQGYERFRLEYLGLWRRYFDPIGMRFALGAEQVRVETYILPLIQNSSYNALREWAGNGATTLDPNGFSPRTVLEFKTHLNAPSLRRELAAPMSALGGKVNLDFLGDWFSLRFDDSPIYAKLAALSDFGSERPPNADPGEYVDLLFHIPVMAGFGIRNPLILAGFLGTVRTSVLASLPGTISWEPMEPPYRGTPIVRVQANREQLGTFLPPTKGDPKKAFNPAIYYAMIEGNLYASLSETMIKERIDAAVARRESQPSPKKSEPIPINSSLYLAPGAAIQTADFIHMFVEKEVHERALANEPILYALYRTGLINASATKEQLGAAAMTYVGFVPVSPDGVDYVYDSKTDEVRNLRHGSLRRPQKQATMAPSPLATFVDQILSIRADLLFRGDGIDTVLTLQRRGK